jgi:hypothetical protein
MIERFLDIMCTATERIAPIYVQLPTADRDEAIYRERVYTYELYHQMRNLLDADEELREYLFSGELDKSGHAIMRVPTADNEKGWRSCIPDFVLHSPGRMESNIAVIEVKPANGDPAGIVKDIETLSYFVGDQVAYRVGVELVYGGETRDIERFAEAVAVLKSEKLRLYWHPPGGRAQRVV